MRASGFGHFSFNERIPGTQQVGNWIGHRADMDVGAKIKIPSPGRNRFPIIQPVVSHFPSFVLKINSTTRLVILLIILSLPLA
jgi:hypothetical protein